MAIGKEICDAKKRMPTVLRVRAATRCRVPVEPILVDCRSSVVSVFSPRRLTVHKDAYDHSYLVVCQRIGDGLHAILSDLIDRERL